MAEPEELTPEGAYGPFIIATLYYALVLGVAELSRLVERQRKVAKTLAFGGNRTPVECLEGIHADHYTTNALELRSGLE